MFKFIIAGIVFACSSICSAQIPLTVITYNIRLDTSSDWFARSWKKRKNTVIQYLAKNKPGIIGLQEVLHQQLLDISHALPDYAYIGKGRDDGKTRGEYSPIFYHRKTWKLDASEHGTFWLSDTPTVPNSKSWGNQVTRICTWARLIGKNGRAIYVYNTHWDHRSQTSREKSAELILKTIQARTHKNEPFILMGDFNASTTNPAIKKLLESKLMNDHGKLQFRTFNGWNPKLIPGLRIDHIFTSPAFKHVNVIVQSNGTPPGSDHHPVRATLSMP